MRSGPIRQDFWCGPFVRTLPAKEAVRRRGRTLAAVYSRRIALGLPDGRSRGAMLKGWQEAMGEPTAPR